MAAAMVAALPCVAPAVWPGGSAPWDGGAQPVQDNGHEDRNTGDASGLGEDLSPALCGLVSGMHTKEKALKPAGQSAAAFPELLEDSGPVSTGMGYDLGSGLRFQGVGVFDPDKNYASLGPAFRLNIDKGLEITTGMQLQVTENGSGAPPDLYYAEIRLIF